MKTLADLQALADKFTVLAAQVYLAADACPPEAEHDTALGKASLSIRARRHAVNSFVKSGYFAPAYDMLESDCAALEAALGQ